MPENEYYEGAEKLLEIWFVCQDRKEKDGDLRNIPKEKYEGLLKSVGCDVISYSSNSEIDAYVLSESSMFISKNRFILKTCGTTTPLACIKLLLHNILKLTRFTKVEDVFYSRKNFGRPNRQKDIYRSFQLETECLNSIFKEIGVTRCMQSSKTDDSWYLYTLNPAIYLRKQPRIPDQTLEIIMTQLDPSVMRIFTKEHSANSRQATQDSGILDLLPYMKINDYLFDPHGYSMNGVNEKGYYMTIHITPQQEFSYVSFETNVPEINKELISKVLKIFKPEKFILTIFTNKTSPCKSNHKKLKRLTKLDKWQQDTNMTCSLKNYDLTVYFYSIHYFLDDIIMAHSSN